MSKNGKLWEITPMLTLAQLQQLCPRTSADRLQEVVNSLPDPINPYLLATLLEESQHFARMEENLNYSADRLHAVWPHRFPTIASANPYAHQPALLANKVYGGRMGNTAPNDGYEFRGGGFIQMTGREMYTAYAVHAGLDLPTATNLVRTTVEYAMKSAIWIYFDVKKLGDAVDLQTITLAINGGYTNIDARETDLRAVLQLFNKS